MMDMKKRQLLLILLLCSLLLSGCMRINTTVKVNKDGTADVSMLYAMSNSMGMLTNNPYSLSADQIAEYEEQGYTFTHYADDEAGYTGYTLTKNGIDLKSLVNDTDETGLESIIDGGFVTVDGRNVMISFVPFSSSDYSNVGSYLSAVKNQKGFVTFTLELPVKPTSHNATSVSEGGQTLTWDLTLFGADEKVFAEFTMPFVMTSSMWIAVAVVVGMIVTAGLVTILVTRKRKERVETNEE